MENNYFVQMIKPVENISNGYLVLACEDNIVTLNEIAYFIYTNCDGKTLPEIAKTLHAAITDNQQVPIAKVLEDTDLALRSLVSNGLVIEKEVVRNAN